ncbi:hypothetical protein K457DRAFT_22774 [Linnemannia elongata AG-77]|uniref:Uncharacterized protein n=1 Tax=Linnemannia elongata AG-77 TaxID=1314771 RepID=A0A197JL84_9FUNG|nr:hypothetical protein K457DRAFT_22774 [Linnemannia elongata AG-77]
MVTAAGSTSATPLAGIPSSAALVVKDDTVFLATFVQWCTTATPARSIELKYTTVHYGREDLRLLSSRVFNPAIGQVRHHNTTTMAPIFVS